MSSTNHLGSEDLLNSWKEIATYLQRGVRTVQRWEAEFGLPVRRPAGKKRSAVIAIRSELDQWLRSCGSSRNAVNDEQSRATPVVTLVGRRLPANRQTIMDSVQESVALRRQLQQTRAEFAQAVAQYSLTVRRIKLPPFCG
ncbi:MAG TPA: hypothetical protein VFI72_02285 [Candidatus Angelobacter sp.]|nr:hypothetical protein [Candidatus Angelobacter sp.]